MPDGILSIINTKLLKASTCANKIMANATQHRAGVGTYDNARLITEILDDVMKIDLLEFRREIEQQKAGSQPSAGV